MAIGEQITELQHALPVGVTLVAVSKTHPEEAIMEAYRAGQRIFGENRPQELKVKYESLPKDIRWHMIGHLQTNKVKYIAPFVELIHSVDSDRLLEIIDREAAKNNRVIDVLFEVHVAQEETKHGWDRNELMNYVIAGECAKYTHVRFRGIMGIASLTDDQAQIRSEFTQLKTIFEQLRHYLGNSFDTLSMGMTSDYPMAIECGSTMVRIGSKIFGERNYMNK